MYDGSNQLARGGNNLGDFENSFKYLKYGVVTDDSNVEGLDKIKVRIKGSRASGGDDGISDAELSFASPILPKHINILPKKGEAVWIFVLGKKNQFTDRLYIGPIVSQLNKLNFDDGRTTGLTNFSFSPIKPNININNIPDLKGVFPDSKDVSIQGRYNTDITQRNNEIILRAGKFVSETVNEDNPYNFAFNDKTQTYIQIKNDVGLDGKKISVTNIVSNKINLLTHDEGSPRYNLLNQDNLINDDELNKILTTAHQLPFGDVLLEYLKLLKNAIINHVHNGVGNPATDLATSGNIQSVKELKDKCDDLEKKMLSKNIRIN